MFRLVFLLALLDAALALSGAPLAWRLGLSLGLAGLGALGLLTNLANPSSGSTATVPTADPRPQDEGRERRLALSERLSRTGAFELDLDSGELWSSPGLRRLVGCETLTLPELRALVHPEDRERLEELESASGSQPFELECRVVRADGPVRNLIFRVETLGRLRVGAVQDVTARTSAVDTLRKTRERYRLALRHAPVLIFEEDRAGLCCWVDKQTPGLTPLESLAEHLPSEVLARIRSLKASVLCQGLAHREELRFHRGGTLQSYDLCLDCRCDKRGQVAGLIVAVVDLGTQRRAEEEARLLRTAFDQSTLGVVVTDALGRVQYRNERCLELGLQASPYEILPCFERDSAGPLLEAFLAGRPWEGDLEGDRRLALGPVCDADGAVGHFTLLVSDVAEERRRREELEQTRALLAQSQKIEAVGRLAGGMAHDFNNLLAVIEGNCGLLREELGDNPGAAELLSQVVGASQRGACLTRQLLSFSRCHRREWGQFDLNEALAELVPGLRPALGEDIRLTLDCTSELLPLQGDRNQLEQVVLNLVLNARDAMPGGGELSLRTASLSCPATVSCGTHELPPGAYLVLEVIDSGCGMSPETLGHLFEPFFTTKSDGTGLGLSTAFGFVRELSGGFQVESVPGQGSIFRLLLPRLLEPVPAPAPAPAPEVPIEGCKILLVEDLPDLRRLLDRLLRVRGFEVVTASSGEEAVELFPAASPRLILSDLMLPGLNGVELAQRLAAQDPGVRVLLMSGYGAELNPVGFPFLSKPFTPDQLIRRLQEVLAA